MFTSACSTQECLVFNSECVVCFIGKGAAAERDGNGAPPLVHQTSVQEEGTGR